MSCHGPSHRASGLLAIYTRNHSASPSLAPSSPPPYSSTGAHRLGRLPCNTACCPNATMPIRPSTSLGPPSPAPRRLASVLISAARRLTVTRTRPGQPVLMEGSSVAAAPLFYRSKPTACYCCGKSSCLGFLVRLVALC
ncbi:hypothetical protein DAI22_08g148600 [Oryza sativa Japonica Group]|nr:hypothetical protein DAI22_08g148600 [Oryza sativa Japonica Group]